MTPKVQTGTRQRKSRVGHGDQALAVYRNDSEKAPSTPPVVSSFYKTNKTWTIFDSEAVTVLKEDLLHSNKGVKVFRTILLG